MLRQQLHPRCRGMNAQLQCLKFKTTFRGDYNFAVEHAACGQLRAQCLEQLGKIAIQRFLITALDEDLVPIAEDQSAEAIPLRLKDPGLAHRQFAHSLGKHRQDRRVHRKLHAPCYIGGPLLHVLLFPNNGRVPHISLRFSRNNGRIPPKLTAKSVRINRESDGKSSGIPHLRRKT